MKYVLTENKLSSTVSNFMNSLFTKFTPFKSKVFPNGLFYIDENGNIMAELINNKHGKGIIFDYSLWIKIFNFFSFKTIEEQQKYLTIWGSDYFGIEDLLIDFRDFVETIDDL